MKIGQLSFVQMSEPAETPYGSGGLGSKYQGQRGPTPSRYWQNFSDAHVILVTGASGFVGRHVTRALAESGVRVRAMVRTARGAAALDGVGCELVRGDVTDLASLRAAARGVRTIVHLVAIVEGTPATFERVMAAGTGNLVEAARESDVRRIVLMSALGTGPNATVPYFRAKWAAEQAVGGSGIDHVVLRPSFVFGSDGGALPRFVRIARLFPLTPVIGPGTQRLQPIWIDDVVRAVRLAVDGEGSNGPVELGGPDPVTWSDFWRRLKSALGTRTAVDPRPVLARARACGDVRADPARAPHPRSAPHARGPGQRRLGRRRLDGEARPRRARSRSTSSSAARSRTDRARRGRAVFGRRRRRQSTSGVCPWPGEAGPREFAASVRREPNGRSQAEECEGRPDKGGPRAFGSRRRIGRGASCQTRGGRRREARVPYAWLWRFPVGPGDTPLPVGTSTAGTARI